MTVKQLENIMDRLLEINRDSTIKDYIQYMNKGRAPVVPEVEDEDYDALVSFYESTPTLMERKVSGVLRHKTINSR